MKQLEQVLQMTEIMVKQVEGLAYSKNDKLALKLVGAIEACIQVSEVSGDAYNTRVQQAMKTIMLDKPKPSEMQLGFMEAALTPVAPVQVTE